MITEQEVTEHQKPSVEDLSAPLEEAATVLDHEIEALTDQLTKATNVEQRKAIRKKRKALKQPLKQIREDFLPQLAKYDRQKPCFGDRNSYSKTDSDATVYANERRSHEEWSTETGL